MRENSFQSGFGGTFGVLIALAVVSIFLPMLACGGCLFMGAGLAVVGESERESSRPVAAPVPSVSPAPSASPPAAAPKPADERPRMEILQRGEVDGRETINIRVWADEPRQEHMQWAAERFALGDCTVRFFSRSQELGDEPVAVVDVDGGAMTWR